MAVFVQFIRLDPVQLVIAVQFVLSSLLKSIQIQMVKIQRVTISMVLPYFKVHHPLMLKLHHRVNNSLLRFLIFQNFLLLVQPV